MNSLNCVVSSALLSGLCLCGWNTPNAFAQKDAMDGPPPVLVTVREYLKPDTSGSAHEKAEAAYIHLLRDNKATYRYMGAIGLTGRSRAVFFSGYPSLAAWEEAEKAMYNNPTIAAGLDQADAADGALLESKARTVWMLRKEMSLNPGNLVGMRLLKITHFTIRPGHRQEWEDLIPLVMNGDKKIAGAHWAMFQAKYGGSDGGEYLVITPMKSMDEADKSAGADKEFSAAMGPDGMKKLDQLAANAIEHSETNLLLIMPSISYPPDEWVKAEPDFWNPKR